MASYKAKSGGSDSELGIASSTQTLGVNSTSGTISFYRDRKGLRIGLIVLCVVLALVCIALTVYLVWDAYKENDSKDEKAREETKNDEVNFCSSATCLSVAAALKQNMNESIDPCEDFFQYSCGNWIKNNPIPPSEIRISNFDKLAKENGQKLAFLLLENDDLPSGHAVRKAKDYFKSCMAEDDNENIAIHELKRLIARFGSWPLGNATWNETTWNLVEILVDFQRDFSSMSPLFKLEIDANPFNSSRYILKVLLL